MKWEEEKWLRLQVAELLERLPTERAAGAKEFAEWCDTEGKPDELAYQGCGGACYTRCVNGLSRFFASTGEKKE